MKMYRVRALGILGVLIAGCQEPTQIVQSRPPGDYTDGRKTLNEAEEPQAIGEVAEKGMDASSMREDATKLPLAPPTAKGETRTTKSGVKYETLQEGTGPEVKGGQRVVVNYTGTLEDGTVFDTSRTISRVPYSFIIGISPVIKGWTEGVAGMRVGERRKLIVPPEMGYGAMGKGNVPANATMIFDIELMSAK